jgi:putative ABC transport system permease protein
MNLRLLVWKEIWERPTALATTCLAVLLGVTALVTIRHVTVSSEQEVARQLESLGANVLILPRDATLQDYYSADMQGGSLPEEHVDEVLMSGLTGVERLSPKLCVPAQLAGRQVTLTGILPQSEFAAKTAWQSINLFSQKHQGCKKAHVEPTAEDAAPEALATRRSIEDLAEGETVVGADIAARDNIRPGSSVELLGRSLRVLAILPRTGTVDDSRVFAHLHTVQRMAQAGQVVSAIEVMGCCEDAAGQLVPDLQKLLPDAKVVTISQVVKTQVGVNRLMAKGSLFVFGVLVIVGGASVASAISANVRERRREIGTMLALGATSGLIARMFLLKAAVVGLAGGLGGAALGMSLAVWFGPRWAGVAVGPLPSFAVLSALVAVVVALVAAYWPARRAAGLDPCICFQEV